MTGQKLKAWIAARGPAALVSAVAVAGCTVNGAPPPPIVITSGAVIIDWTIRGAKDTNDCQDSGATTLHVALADSSGALPTEYVQSCTAFATTISNLVPDTYTGTVELLDASGNARTTSVNLAPFDVIGGRTVTVGVDFPANSFF
jgi:hypothetical protein